MAIYNFFLPGIRCVNCVKTIERVLDKCGLTFSEMNVEVVTKKLMVHVIDTDKQPEEIKQVIIHALNEVGEKCSFIEGAELILPVNSTSQEGEIADTKGNNLTSSWWKSHRFLGFLGTSAGLVWVIISLLGISLSMPLMIPMGLISIALTLFLGADSYREAYTKLVKARTLTMDTLFAISTLTIIAVSIAGFFLPWMPMMFDAGLLIFGFRHIGVAIEESFKQSMGLNVVFKDRLPKEVIVMGSGKKLALSDVLPGQIIIVQPGELIPLDGESVSEKGLIYDTIITGSVLPRPLVPGEALITGMYLAEDSEPIYLKVTHIVAESNYARMDQHIAKVNKEKAPIQTTTDQILQYFIPTIIFIALLATITIANFYPLALAIQCGVSVLVSACPCTLGFIIPLAILIGMKKGVDNGVQFKSGKALEVAASIDRVAFDLHGTITQGVFSVRSFGAQSNSELSAKQVLALLGAIEKNSAHPIARDLCKYIEDEKIDSEEELRVSAVDKSNHSGISAMINNRPYVVGNQNMMKKHGIETQSVDASVKIEDDEQLIYLARNKLVVGYVVLTDPLRENARFAVDSLKEMGIEVYMITGADVATAKRFGNLLGIEPEFIRAGRLPTEKSTEIELLRNEHKVARIGDKKSTEIELLKNVHKVAMIGDNSNDAIAMACADFGIAVSGVDKVTEQEAGALIHSGCLLPVINAFSTARQTVANIKQNLLISLVYNLGALFLTCGVLLTVGISLNPAVGVALMFMQSMLVLSNAYRFKQQKLAYVPNLADENNQGIEPSTSYQLVNDCMPSWRVDLESEPELEAPSPIQPLPQLTSLEQVDEISITCGI
jgi:Cu2+-exporting ATPase